VKRRYAYPSSGVHGGGSCVLDVRRDRSAIPRPKVHVHSLFIALKGEAIVGLGQLILESEVAQDALSTSVCVERRSKGTTFEVGHTTGTIVLRYVTVEKTIRSGVNRGVLAGVIIFLRDVAHPC